MAGSNRLSAAESTAVLAQIDDDVAAGRLWKMPLDLHATVVRAEALSARHARRLLSRSLDLLHVAAALELGCTRFVTLDTRQARLAAACGLKTFDLTLKGAPSRRG
jgi:predicted nucleic acid-binding protein